MAIITLRVLDGADRGRVFEDVATPLTIGREEGNPIQLNDERVSRFHVKIQEDDGKLVLVDLESTNGTKLNGENVQLGILRPGDILLIGKSLLLVGSRAEIAARLAELRGADLAEGIALEAEEPTGDPGSAELDFELHFGDGYDAMRTLHTLVPPEIPASLSPGQAAQLAELLQYLHLRLRGLVQSVRKERGERVSLEQRQWQGLLDLQSRLADYVRTIGEPGDE